jgi:hypothetical protein
MTTQVAKKKKALAPPIEIQDDAPQVVKGAVQNAGETPPLQEPRHWLRQPSVTPASTAARLEYVPFATTLRNAMLKQSLSAAEVARRVWGTHQDKRGYEVAKGRDRIGAYLAGTSYPGPENLQKLADAVEVPLETLEIAARPRPRLTKGPRSFTLAHEMTHVAMSAPTEDVQLVLVGADLAMAQLVFKRTIPAQLALKIIELLRADEMATRIANLEPEDERDSASPDAA